MLRDAEYFKSRIGGLDGAKDAGDYIVNIVKDKLVPIAKVTPQEPAPATTNGKTSSESSTEPKAEEEKAEDKEDTKVEGEKT
jgi:vacuolar protein sorting-associated protein 54